MERQIKAQELTALASTLSEGLTGEGGVSSQVGALMREARQLEALDTSSKALADRLASAAIEISDLGAEFANLCAELQFDPEQAESLQERMNTWLDVKRKYGGELRAVIAAREEMRERLAVQGDLGGTLARLETEISTHKRNAQKAGRDFARNPRKGGEGTCKDCGEKHRPARFQESGFPSAAHLAAGTYPSSGDCRCEFLFPLMSVKRPCL